MKWAGITLILAGAVLLGYAALNSSRAPDFSALVGMFLPGMICLGAGLALTQRPAKPPGKGE